jgi:hypothetical protein
MGVAVGENFQDLIVQEQYDVLLSGISAAGVKTLGGKIQEKPKAKKKRKKILWDTVPSVHIRRLREKRRKARRKAKLQRGCQSSPEINMITQRIKEIERSERQLKFVKLARDAVGYGVHQKNLFYAWMKKLKEANSAEVSMRDARGEIIHDKGVLKREAGDLVRSVFKARKFPNKRMAWDKEFPKFRVGSIPLDKPSKLELDRALRGMKVGKKSAGYSNIPPGCLKFMGEGMKERVVEWMGQMWELQDTPKEIGKSLITLLHKKGSPGIVQKLQNIGSRMQPL